MIGNFTCDCRQTFLEMFYQADAENVVYCTCFKFHGNLYDKAVEVVNKVGEYKILSEISKAVVAVFVLVKTTNNFLRCILIIILFFQALAAAGYKSRDPKALPVSLVTSIRGTTFLMDGLLSIYYAVSYCLVFVIILIVMCIVHLAQMILIGILSIFVLLANCCTCCRYKEELIGSTSFIDNLLESFGSLNFNREEEEQVSLVMQNIIDDLRNSCQELDINVVKYFMARSVNRDKFCFVWCLSGNDRRSFIETYTSKLREGTLCVDHFLEGKIKISDWIDILQSLELKWRYCIYREAYWGENRGSTIISPKKTSYRVKVDDIGDCNSEYRTRNLLVKNGHVSIMASVYQSAYENHRQGYWDDYVMGTMSIVKYIWNQWVR